MIKVNHKKTVFYYNEQILLFFWQNKEEKWLHFNLLKNNKTRFSINNKYYRYYNQDNILIKTGISEEHD